ncbi:hydroxymethylglutaryl-CoA lyase [Hoeflea alexandrii]|uniref:hydroxymethylglutaryl-CoA lyase n=1 Tax=Hoeflea alexandrii TaxID=288436 RepID=UPI0022AEFEC6|nr:hydroxymethylglutaryl-CoA lyase [Hoeflea alexandrii]MCZ4291608.1 hydroxymethylglutaryl-CoA lyase [Hoeflea alexandrii]
MSDLPKSVYLNEEGPREGFQIEAATIPTARKIELVNRLAQTGLRHIQVASFVNPRAVPGMADADAVVQGFQPVPDVHFTALWLNERGFQRALAHADRLTLNGSLNLYASDAFLMRNQNRVPEQQRAAQHELIAMYQQAGVKVKRGFITAAFGCNFEGDIPVRRVVQHVGDLLAIADEHGETIDHMGLGDTMAWATPESIKRVVGGIREAHPDLELLLHLHDTRGLGIANAYAGLEMGVRMFDTAVAGLGGCPFAGHSGAAGNVCTEDLVFMCEEMGIETGVDLDALIDCAVLAESIVGHALPGSVLRGGGLRKYRQQQ